jgi:hypothetical protein
LALIVTGGMVNANSLGRSGQGRPARRVGVGGLSFRIAYPTNVALNRE